MRLKSNKAVLTLFIIIAVLCTSLTLAVEHIFEGETAQIVASTSEQFAYIRSKVNGKPQNGVGFGLKITKMSTLDVHHHVIEVDPVGEKEWLFELVSANQCTYTYNDTESGRSFILEYTLIEEDDIYIFAGVPLSLHKDALKVKATIGWTFGPGAEYMLVTCYVSPLVDQWLDNYITVHNDDIIESNRVHKYFNGTTVLVLKYIVNDVIMDKPLNISLGEDESELQFTALRYNGTLIYDPEFSIALGDYNNDDSDSEDLSWVAAVVIIPVVVIAAVVIVVVVLAITWFIVYRRRRILSGMHVDSNDEINM